MKLTFHKYQGTGNDFVMVDNRTLTFRPTDSTIAEICDRRFGIGADGLILIEPSETTDFKMVYFNPDGSQSLCGNGSRCAVMFSKYLGIINDDCTFEAIDGIHKAQVSGELVHLEMLDVNGFEQIGSDYLIDTGSPHYIKYVVSVDSIDPIEEGRKIRYSEAYAKEGVNVNFVEVVKDNHLRIRTYERGVESETFSCGTGCTAVAIAQSIESGKDHIDLDAKGGQLQVKFDRSDNSFKNIYLTGPAKRVFEGQIVL